MKVALVVFFYDENISSEETLLRQYYTLTGWAESLQGEGAEVIVICRFKKNSELNKNGVRYIFIKDGLGAQFRSWEIPLRFLKAVAALDGDVVHLHHFTLSLQTLMLRLLLHKKTAVILQHHGGKPPAGYTIQWHNRINAVADGYFFTSIEQGRDWFTNKKQQEKLMAVMEGGSFFNFDTRDADRDFSYADRNAARKGTGMQGQPVFLWVGRLNANKDPITVLNGFELIVQSHRQAKIYMIYGDNELENEVKKLIASSTLLSNHVTLLGKVPHHELIYYYNSADYFVTGSHYEGSSYSLSEALSCGCIPVVTDIPSLRTMTNNGHLGSLWQPGDKQSFSEAAIKTLQKPSEAEAIACINFYRENLSWKAIARTAITHYRTAINRRLKR
jgi:glycosyltransferase involved in cell wall biosynthesis